MREAREMGRKFGVVELAKGANRKGGVGVGIGMGMAMAVGMEWEGEGGEGVDERRGAF